MYGESLEGSRHQSTVSPAHKFILILLYTPASPGSDINFVQIYKQGHIDGTVCLTVNNLVTFLFKWPLKMSYVFRRPPAMQA